jgi:creatine kinase
MELKVKKIFEEINDPGLQGTYYPLTGMTKEVQTQLIQDHFLFKEGDR